MISAGVTCPLDVCKTRIIARDKKLITTTVSTTITSIVTNNLFSNDTIQSIQSIDSIDTIKTIEQPIKNNGNVLIELYTIFKEEGPLSIH